MFFVVCEQSSADYPHAEQLPMLADVFQQMKTNTFHPKLVFQQHQLIKTIQLPQ